MLSVAALAEEHVVQRRGVDAFVWTADTDVAARWPVVVLSHRIHLCPNGSRCITEPIAAAGYLVIAPVGPH
jgi:hypothetical protein